MKKTALLFALVLSIQINAKTISDFRALFIYQFTKLIEWPEETRKGMFRIGVIGSFEAYKGISDITMGRNVGSQNIEVMNVMSISQLPLTEFHILLVGEDFCNSESIKEINAKLKSKSTLIIAEKLNYNGDDVCIRFEGHNTDFKYWYTYPTMLSKGLKCSQDFLLLGKKVNQ